MNNLLLKKFKKGAASFYMIAFSTLILIIIVTSFAAVIISEVTRTANDDLSQSAYDSALAGIEDAKLVVSNYKKCKSGEVADQEWCTKIVESIEGEADCDMVGKILGRSDGGEVLIQESDVSNNMAQAYTCVKIGFPGNYRTVLSSSNQMKVVKTKFVDDEDGNVAQRVKQVKISWSADQESLNYVNFDSSNKAVVFPEASAIAVPPTISISMIQTAESFKLDDFAESQGDRTNRGTLYLVPTDDSDAASQDRDTYRAGYDRNINHIEASGFVKSNDKKAKNLPYAVYCPQGDGAELACSVLIDIPDPVGDTGRNPDTFIFVVALPYGAPTTVVDLSYYCGEDEKCSEDTTINADGTEEKTPSKDAKLDGVQILVDSTGRANDMYRRVEVRLENESDGLLSLRGPLELLGNGQNDILLKKDLEVTSEWDY